MFSLQYQLPVLASLPLQSSTPRMVLLFITVKFLFLYTALV